jgi:hypothetical protein
MSALGQKRTFHDVAPMSALPPKADIAELEQHVRLSAKSGLMHRSKIATYSITLSARVSALGDR